MFRIMENPNVMTEEEFQRKIEASNAAFETSGYAAPAAAVSRSCTLLLAGGRHRQTGIDTQI